MAIPTPEPYSDPGFWNKLRDHARLAGREVLERALCLYYAARRPDTPAWARTVIYGALAYFVAPLDAVPDITPVLGFSDDLGVLVSAVVTVALYIDDTVREQARDKLSQWLGPAPDSLKP